MCLIIHRPKACTVPQDWIENALIQNPDGWGIMSSDGTRLRIARGMTAGGFSRALKKFKNREVFIHFRFATHGNVDINNCHPFTIVNDQFAVMHNGVINIDTSLDDNRSDSWHYANRFLAPLLEQNLAAVSDPNFAESIGKHVGAGNKLVILRANGSHAIVNRSQGTELQGCWLSNTCSIASRWVDDWTTCYSLSDLAKFDRDELIQLCLDDPESVADAIQEHSWSSWSFDRDYR